MRLHRGRANVQILADFPVAGPFGHQLQHFNFAGAQVFFGRGAHSGHEAGSDSRGQHRFAVGGGANGAVQLFARRVLKQREYGIRASTEIHLVYHNQLHQQEKPHGQST